MLLFFLFALMEQFCPEMCPRSSLMKKHICVFRDIGAASDWALFCFLSWSHPISLSHFLFIMCMINRAAHRWGWSRQEKRPEATHASAVKINLFVASPSHIYQIICKSYFSLPVTPTKPIRLPVSWAVAEGWVYGQGARWRDTSTLSWACTFWSPS